MDPLSYLSFPFPPEPVPVHVTSPFHVRSLPTLGTLRACHLVSDSQRELQDFAPRLRVSLSALRWSRAGMPFFTIGLFSRETALRFGATPIARSELALLVRLWRTRHARTIGRLRQPPPYRPNPF